jgi:hypothetical protein
MALVARAVAAYSAPIDKLQPAPQEPTMNQPTFLKTRQQASALLMSVTVTFAMLMSMNLLATQPVADAQMAAAASAPHAHAQSNEQHA